jgi:hypothetical protein
MSASFAGGTANHAEIKAVRQRPKGAGVPLGFDAKSRGFRRVG